MDWVADVVDRANQKLRDRHAAIGPSYFMKSHLDDDAVESIWQHSILPYVEERLFGENIPAERIRPYTNCCEGRTAQRDLERGTPVKVPGD